MSHKNFIEAVGACFAPTGAFAQAMGAKYQHRSQQTEFALSLAEFLIGDTTSPMAITKNINPKIKPMIYTGDIAPGMGKTLVYIIVLALAHHFLGKRGMIATFTRQLRQDIIYDQDLVNRVLTLMQLPPIVVAPFISLTSACSYDKAVEVEARLRNKIGHAESVDYLNYVKSSYENLQMPQVSEFIENGGDFEFAFDGVIYDHNTPSVVDFMSIRFRELEKRNRRLLMLEKKYPDYFNRSIDEVPESERMDFCIDKTLYLQVKQNKATKYEAEIVVVTHAMFIANTNNFGVILNTNKKNIKRGKAIVEATPDRFNIIIDEGDVFHKQALNHYDVHVRLEDISDILNRCSALKRLAIWCNNLQSQYVLHTHDETAVFCELVEPIITKLTEKQKKAGDFTHDHIEKLKVQLRSFVQCIKGLGNSSRYGVDAEIEILVKREGSSHVLKLESKRGDKVASRAWVHTSVHAFERIAFVSGTLSGHTLKDMSDFYKSTGISAGKSDVIWAKNTIAPSMYIAQDNNQRIDRLVFSKFNGSPYLDGGSLNTQYWDYVIETIMAMPHDRNTLVLLPSYKTLDYVANGIETRQIDAKVIRQRQSGAAATVNQLRKTWKLQHNIVLGMNWSGVNYVDDHQTMITRVIIPVMPFAPKRDSDDFYIFHYGHDGARKTRQGIGRGFRNQGDHCEFWFLDPRLPVPMLLNDNSVERGSPINQAIADSLFTKKILLANGPLRVSIIDGNEARDLRQRL